jgi:Ca2+-binding RTX toxin-like protein
MNPETRFFLQECFAPTGCALFIRKTLVMTERQKIMALTIQDLFDSDYYLEQNPDVKAAVDSKKVNTITLLTLVKQPDSAEEIAGDYSLAWQHFQQVGQIEGRDPSSLFDTEFYLSQNPDVAQAIASGQFKSAIEHYEKVGQLEGRQPIPGFNEPLYLQQNPDVAQAIASGQISSAYEHYVRFGETETRSGAPRIITVAPSTDSSPESQFPSPVSPAKIDVTLEPGKEQTFQITVQAPRETKPLPLDVFLLQDLSGSFEEDLPIVGDLVPNLVNGLKQFQVEPRFGIGPFIDKPIGGFGITGDFVYETALPLTTDTAALQSAIGSFSTTEDVGKDIPEAQLEALLQTAKRASSEIGYRSGARRVVVVATDAPYHQAGDGAVAGITTPNNLDGILDGNPPGTGEDYPSVAEVRDALINANIIPVFTVTAHVMSDYQNLVSQLGFGTVVKLESDSSNLVNAITQGLGGISSEIIPTVSSDDVDYVKTITPSKIPNVNPGESYTFDVTLGYNGQGGDDFLSINFPGLGDTSFKVTAPSSVQGQETINFKLKNQSLDGSGETFNLDLDGVAEFKQKLFPEESDFQVELTGKADVKILFSPGTFNADFSSLFTFGYDPSVQVGETAIVNVKSNFDPKGKFETAWGASARLGLEAAVSGEYKPWNLKFTPLQFGLDLTESDLLRFGGPWGQALRELLSLDFRLEAHTDKSENNTFTAEDEDGAFNGINVNVGKLLKILNTGKQKDSSKDNISSKKPDDDKIWDAISLSAGLNFNQKSSLTITGFEVDWDGQKNGNEILITPDQNSGELKIPLKTNDVLGKPFDITIKPQLTIQENWDNSQVKIKAEADWSKLIELFFKDAPPGIDAQIAKAIKFLDDLDPIDPLLAGKLEWDFDIPPELLSKLGLLVNSEKESSVNLDDYAEKVQTKPVIFGAKPGSGNDDDDILYGTSGDDNNLLGNGTGKDTFYGEGGNDFITGGLGNDHLYGEEGNDTLIGSVTTAMGTAGGDLSDVNQINNLTGGTGADTLDPLTKTILKVTRVIGTAGGDLPGVNEIDNLTGGTGSDTFVLGNSAIVYYADLDPTNPGINDYAIINDFNPNEGDVIQLAAGYSYLLDTAPGLENIPAATEPAATEVKGIYVNNGDGVRQETDELIGIIQSPFALNSGLITPQTPGFSFA